MTPRINRLALCVVALALPLAGCSSDSKSATTTVSPTSVPAETTAPVETTAPAETTAPVETSAPETTAVAGPVVIEVDADSGSPIAQTVALGTELSIHVVSATADEWHLHGYDIELTGTDVTFEFTANKAGEFELEGHETEAVILNLTVTG
jgi:hypothetical protein